MKNISLYVDNGTYLTKLHPFTKALYIAASISISLIVGSFWMFAFFIGLSLILLISGKLLKKAFPLITFSFTILITIFLIHGLFRKGNTTLAFSIGALHFYKEGLLYAAGIGLNILNMLLSFAVFVLSTKPLDLVNEMEKVGFSKKLGYVIISVFQIIPGMMGTMNTIMDAQRSRGLETEGKLWVRAKAFIPLISPVVTSSLINTRERAVALEVRGFEVKGKKTFLTDWEKTFWDKICISVMLLGIVSAILWRVLSWLI